MCFTLRKLCTKKNWENSRTTQLSKSHWDPRNATHFNRFSKYRWNVSIYWNPNDMKKFPEKNNPHQKNKIPTKKIPKCPKKLQKKISKSQISIFTYKIISTVRKAFGSWHTVGLVTGPPETSRTSQQYCIEGFKGCSRLGAHCDERCQPFGLPRCVFSSSQYTNNKLFNQLLNSN